MSQPYGTLGSLLYITDAPIASTIDTEGEFTAETWVEIGLIENLGEFGKVFDLVTFQAVADGRTYKLKGGYNEGNMQMTLAQDLSDAGQTLLRTAANASTQDNYGFRISFNDPPSTVGGPTEFFFRGLTMSFRTQLGAVNSVVRSMVNLEINSEIIYAPPAELYDQFLTGGSLTHYELFNGSDAEAVDPVISSNTLVLVTGNASAGDVASNGSQAIGDTGYTAAGGPLTVEARVKFSAITAVGFFFGLTDQKAALEAPIISAASADTITTNATDAVGFMFDTAMATDNFWLTGVNNNVDETAQNAGSAPVVDTYVTLRLEIEADGDTTFKIDGVAVGSVMATAFATGVTMYPTIIATALGAASRTITVDYLYLRQD